MSFDKQLEMFPCLTQSLCTSVHPSEMPFLSSCRMLLGESYQTARGPYRYGGSPFPKHQGFSFWENDTSGEGSMVFFIVSTLIGFGCGGLEMFLFCYPRAWSSAELFQRHIQGAVDGLRQRIAPPVPGPAPRPLESWNGPEI